MDSPSSCRTRSSNGARTKKRKQLDHLDQKGSVMKYFKKSSSPESSQVTDSPKQIDFRMKFDSFYSPSSDRKSNDEFRGSSEKKRIVSTSRSPLTRMNGPNKKRALDFKTAPTKVAKRKQDDFPEFPDIDIDDIIADISSSKKFKPSSVIDEKLTKREGMFPKSSSFPLFDDKARSFSEKPSSSISSLEQVPKAVKDKTVKPIHSKTEKLAISDLTSSESCSSPVENKRQHRIVRHSRTNIEDNEVISIVSSSTQGRKYTVLPDELQIATSIAFNQTYQDLETILDLKTTSQVISTHFFTRYQFLY